MAKVGQVINFICSEEQAIRLLREITYNDGLVIRKESSAEGLRITVRKT